MSDCMQFPDTWEEFEQAYGFEDKKEIYTNGSRLIQSFRVKQWLDHIAEPERKWTAHEVACILSELFGDDCACDYCGIDEWLPEKCDFGTLCPDKDLCGVVCWEQYLKHRGDHESA